MGVPEQPKPVKSVRPAQAEGRDEEAGEGLEPEVPLPGEKTPADEQNEASPRPQPEGGSAC